jgi:hypothetical protein
MAAVWPLKFSIALDLRILQVSTVDVGFFSFYLLVWEVGLLVILDSLPLFMAFAINKVSTIKESLDLNGAIV